MTCGAADDSAGDFERLRFTELVFIDLPFRQINEKICSIWGSSFYRVKSLQFAKSELGDPGDSCSSSRKPERMFEKFLICHMPRRKILREKN